LLYSFPICFGRAVGQAFQPILPLMKSLIELIDRIERLQTHDRTFRDSCGLDLRRWGLWTGLAFWVVSLLKRPVA